MLKESTIRWMPQTRTVMASDCIAKRPLKHYQTTTTAASNPLRFLKPPVPHQHHARAAVSAQLLLEAQLHPQAASLVLLGSRQSPIVTNRSKSCSYRRRGSHGHTCPGFRLLKAFTNARHRGQSYSAPQHHKGRHATIEPVQ